MVCFVYTLLSNPSQSQFQKVHRGLQSNEKQRELFMTYVTGCQRARCKPYPEAEVTGRSNNQFLHFG
jgi:hypothetical protein